MSFSEIYETGGKNLKEHPAAKIQPTNLKTNQIRNPGFNISETGLC